MKWTEMGAALAVINRDPEALEVGVMLDEWKVRLRTACAITDEEIDDLIVHILATVAQEVHPTESLRWLLRSMWGKVTLSDDYESLKRWLKVAKTTPPHDEPKKATVSFDGERVQPDIKAGGDPYDMSPGMGVMTAVQERPAAIVIEGLEKIGWCDDLLHVVNDHLIETRKIRVVQNGRLWEVLAGGGVRTGRSHVASTMGQAVAWALSQPQPESEKRTGFVATRYFVSRRSRKYAYVTPGDGIVPSPPCEGAFLSDTWDDGAIYWLIDLTPEGLEAFMVKYECVVVTMKHTRFGNEPVPHLLILDDYL